MNPGLLEQVERIELSSQRWQRGVITIIPYLHGQLFITGTDPPVQALKSRLTADLVDIALDPLGLWQEVPTNNQANYCT